MSLAVVYRSDALFDYRLEAYSLKFLGDRVINLSRRSRLSLVCASKIIDVKFAIPERDR